jgi:hypothetical protein
MPKRKGGARPPLSYRRFASAAEAVRFAVEELPAVRTLGARASRQDDSLRECRIASSAKPFTLRPVTLHLSYCLKLTSLKGSNLHGAKNLDNGGRLNMGMRNIMEIFNGEGRPFDDSAQRSASNECVRLIRKLRWIGMDEEAERVLAQLSGWPFRPTETVIAGPWATD